MSVAHYSLTIFVALNAARAIAYWPQIVNIYRDPGRASAVSLWTRTIFITANVATVIYALAALKRGRTRSMSSVLSARFRNCGERREARQTWAFRPTLGNLWVSCECVVGPAGVVSPLPINDLGQKCGRKDWLIGKGYFDPRPNLTCGIL